MAVLAEVHNTHGDRHNYLLHNHGEPFDWGSRPHAAKAFFVSPFIQHDDVTYEFAFSEPAEKLSAAIRDFVGGELTLTGGDLRSRTGGNAASVVDSVLVFDEGREVKTVSELVLLYDSGLGVQASFGEFGLAGQ